MAGDAAVSGRLLCGCAQKRGQASQGCLIRQGQGPGGFVMQQVLRKACGQPRQRFHHLRVTCALSGAELRTGAHKVQMHTLQEAQRLAR
jgi:hypothetical protein